MKLIKTVLFFCLTISHASISFSEPANLSLLKKDIQQYHDCGSYEAEIAGVINQAHEFLVKEVEKNNQRKDKKQLALVLDIDETSLSNYDKMVKYHFALNQEQIHLEILKANSPAIKPTLKLYQDALKLGVKVFFVTGRPQSELQATEANLSSTGYSNWSGLYLRPEAYQQSSIVPFKAHTRTLIQNKGYTIIASIGDQYSDLLGGHAKQTYKLPNPFYFLP